MAQDPAAEREIDEILLSGDIDRVIELLARVHVRPGSRALAEIAMHKARTARFSLPREVREASRQWLVRRGEIPMGH